MARLGCAPYEIDMDPLGRFLYVACYAANNVVAFRIGGTGNLTFAGTIAGQGGPQGLAVNPAGTRLYVASTNVDLIRWQAIDQTLGTLSPLSRFGRTSGPLEPGFSADGAFLYLGQYGGAGVGLYQVDSAGALAFVADYATPTGEVWNVLAVDVP